MKVSQYVRSDSSVASDGAAEVEEEWTDFGLDIDAADLPLSSLYPTPAPYIHGLDLLGQLIP